MSAPPQKKPRVADNLGVGGKPKLGLGAPKARPSSSTYVTAGKVVVISEVEDVEDPAAAVKELTTRLDRCRGVLMSSSYEYPGRYAQWTLGFANPPLCVECWGRRFSIKALNPRGLPFLPVILDAIQQSSAVADWTYATSHISGTVHEASGFFPEEERSKQPSVFSLVRLLVGVFASDEDPHLGLYGAFGYDLAFQFEKIKLHKERDPEQRDLVLFIPDNLLVVNTQANESWRVRYDFVFQGKDGVSCTKGLTGECDEVPFQGRTEMPNGIGRRELAPGEFAGMVEKAKRKFECGDLFEAVLSQTFREPCKDPPSEVFHRLQRRNPAPYGFLINLGQDEFLVGASPEMFVRAERTERMRGLRVETCPISGTIVRGNNALEDAENIRRILSDPKEESEITMCTDVDRNDKSRICEHGTVQVLGRRQIEIYSRLIHTVDHVEGYLRPEFDAIDAFLVHTWAVTVCGAPKAWAMQFVEEMEPSQRCWYGAAIGHVAFDGHLNTGLTLRTLRIKDGVAQVRAGATLLFDSVPESEEKETELKASAALLAVTTPLRAPVTAPSSAVADMEGGECWGLRVLLIDFEDSFVHTLANYLRQTGAEVITVRHSQAERALEGMQKLDLAVLSPGPGNPGHFGVAAHVKRLLDRKLRIFGVCLGLQGLVEYFGGKLGQLSYPMHGKPSNVVLKEQVGPIFQALPSSFPVARYHSLYALRPLPECLVETACLAPPNGGVASRNGSEESVIMGIQHKSLPVAAVQFHPESILTSPDHGLQMLRNAFKLGPA